MGLWGAGRHIFCCQILSKRCPALRRQPIATFDCSIPPSTLWDIDAWQIQTFFCNTCSAISCKSKRPWPANCTNNIQIGSLGKKCTDNSCSELSKWLGKHLFVYDWSKFLIRRYARWMRSWIQFFTEGLGTIHMHTKYSIETLYLKKSFAIEMFFFYFEKDSYPLFDATNILVIRTFRS